MPTNPQQLQVTGEAIQQLYNQYISDVFQVNRKYQRKLVWGVEEKRKLIDSILRDLPLPLILVAEVRRETGTVLELIDGLQRMNAIFAFIENEYAVDGTYFDLDALADTKLRKDRGELRQKTPTMDRELAIQIANYRLAQSVFRAVDDSSVEEVFRRINSGGRQLSKHSLRQAGTVSLLADSVRVISSRVRGDTSPDDSVPLRVMPRLSVTNYQLDYGVNVDTIYWVSEGILRREDIRESLDEQLVLDLLIDCLVEPTPTSGTRVRDAYYDFSDSNLSGEPTAESTALTTAITVMTPERLEQTFMKTYDEIRLITQGGDTKLAKLIGVVSGGRAPRYYHGLFVAVYELLFKERLQVKDRAGLAAELVDIASGALNVPGGGGDWRGAVKRQTFDSVKGRIRKHFEGPIEGDDLGLFGYSSYLETVLGNALVEQQQFEAKQGLMRLDPSRDFDADAFDKICATISAMANTSPGFVGYIALGVADDDADAQRIATLDAVTPTLYRGFNVVGLAREADLKNTSLSDYWQWILQKISSSDLDKALATKVTQAAKLIPYHDHAVALLKVTAGAAPVFYKGELYERAGSSTLRVEQSAYFSVFGRFPQPS